MSYINSYKGIGSSPVSADKPPSRANKALICCKHLVNIIFALGIFLAIGAAVTFAITGFPNYFTFTAAAVAVISFVGWAITLCQPRINNVLPIRNSNIRGGSTESIQVQIEEVESRYNLKIEEITFTVTAFDPDHFSEWVLHHKISEQKKALLQNTVLQALAEFMNEQTISPEQPFSLSCYRTSQATENFEALLDRSISELPEMFIDKDWFDYSNENHTYIDFANAHNLGGGWLKNCNAQEERMFCEYLQLALFAYFSAMTHTSVLPAKNPDSSQADPTPLSFVDMKRSFELDKSTYGKKLHTFEPEDIPGHIRSLPPEEVVPVTITAIAAQDWRRGNRDAKYTEEGLLYHLKAVYLACMFEKEHSKNDKFHLSSGPFGCGAFENNAPMMVAIQVLAASMAGVELDLYAVGDEHLAHYTKTDVEEMYECIKESLEAGATPRKIIKELLKLQKRHPKYFSPKPQKPSKHS